MDRNDRALTAFTMLGHAVFHTYELVIPIFVTRWLDVFDATPATLGVVVGAGYALVGLGALPSGVLADRFGSRRLVLLSLVGMGGAFALASAAPNVALLAVALVVWGAFASIYHPAGLALISRGAKERGTAFAYHGVAGNVGVATGPLLGAVLLVFFGWRTVAQLLLVPVLLAAVAGVRLEFDETAGSDARGTAAADGARTRRWDPRAFLADSKRLLAGGFLPVLAVGVLYGGYYRGAFTFLPDILAGLPLFGGVDVLGRSLETSQYVYAGLLLLGGLGQYAGGRFADRLPVEYVLLGGYLALAVVGLAFVPSADAGLGPLLVVAALLGLLVFGLAPVNQEAISQYTPSDVRGLSFGYTYAAVFGVGALGASLAGVVLTRSTPAALFVVLTGFAATAAAIGAYLLRSRG